MKILLTPAILICFLHSSAQNNKTATFIKHDTVIVSNISLSKTIIQAIKNGKIKAVDYITNQPVPPKQISTWKMPVDTMTVHDKDGNAKYVIVKQHRSANDITRVKIFNDWYLDNSSGKLSSRVQRIELLEEIKNSTGEFMGYRPIFKIYY
jgi:hypothetical protein